LALFDGPDTNTSTDVRPSSTVPLQALFLMNNPFVREQAEALADRLLRSEGEERRRIALAHELAWGRPPQTTEGERDEAYVRRYAEELVRAGTAQNQVEREAWTSLGRVLLTANEFLYVD